MIAYKSDHAREVVCLSKLLCLSTAIRKRTKEFDLANQRKEHGHISRWQEELLPVVANLAEDGLVHQGRHGMVDRPSKQITTALDMVVSRSLARDDTLVIHI